MHIQLTCFILSSWSAVAAAVVATRLRMALPVAVAFGLRMADPDQVAPGLGTMSRWQLATSAVAGAVVAVAGLQWVATTSLQAMLPKYTCSISTAYHMQKVLVCTRHACLSGASSHTHAAQEMLVTEYSMCRWGKLWRATRCSGGRLR